MLTLPWVCGVGLLFVWERLEVVGEGSSKGWKEGSLEEGKKASLIFIPKHEHWIDIAARRLGSLLWKMGNWQEECWTTTADQGTCLSRKECLLEGGFPSGSCGSVFGVCCLLSFQCGTRSAKNGTYFTNPAFPHPAQHFELCTHIITKLDNVCQVRVDFEVFELARPGANGLCQEEAFYVEGAERHMPPLCGHLTQQRIFIATGSSPDMTFSMRLSHVDSLSRWKLRITKLNCDSTMLAPGGCFQFHERASGRVMSFNYAHNANSNLNHLDYGVCVRKQKGFCAIKWSLCEEEGFERRRRSLSTTKEKALEAWRPFFPKTRNYFRKLDKEKSLSGKLKSPSRVGLGVQKKVFPQPPLYYQQIKVVPTKSLLKVKHIVPQSKPVLSKPKVKVPPKGHTLQKLKPKPVVGKPLKGFIRPVLKPPKPPLHFKNKKAKGSGNCSAKVVVLPLPLPLPLPIPIPIPIVPVVVVPFPVSGAHSQGHGDGATGWMEENSVYSATEPFLLRVTTDDQRDDGLASFCVNWEQIPCAEWSHDMHENNFNSVHDDFE